MLPHQAAYRNEWAHASAQLAEAQPDEINVELMIQDLWVRPEASEPLRVFDPAEEARWRGGGWHGILVSEEFCSGERNVGELGDIADAADDTNKVMAPLSTENDDVDGDGEPDPDILVTGEQEEN